MKGHALTAVNNSSLYRWKVSRTPCNVSGPESKIIVFVEFFECIVLKSKVNKRNFRAGKLYAKL